MDLNKSLDILKFDIRMKDYYLKHNLVTQAEIDKHFAALEDAQGACEPVTLEDKADFAD